MKIFKKVLATVLCFVIALCSEPLAGFVGLELPSIRDIFRHKAEAYTYSDNTYGDIIFGTRILVSGNTTTEYHVIEGFKSNEREIHIPSSIPSRGVVDSIDDSALRSGHYVEKFTVASDSNYFSADDYNVLFDKKKTKLIKYPPANSRANYIIPDSVTSIGNFAFYESDNLASITIPAGITHIGREAFGKCRNITNYTVDPANSVYSTDEYGVIYNKDKTKLVQYPSGKPETSYVIPEGVTSIDDYAFYGCINLETITLPNSLTSIGKEAFVDCESLTSFIVCSENDVYSTDEYGVLFNRDKTELIQYPAGNSETSYIVPDYVTSIGECAFAFCSNLERITIFDNISFIKNYTFGGCNDLSVHYVGDSDKINVEKSAFSYNYGDYILGNANSLHYCSFIVNATCEQDGTGNWYCVKCDEDIVCGIPVSALGHDWSDRNGVCAREGCGYICTHSEEDWIWQTTINSTCLPGYEIANCVCNISETTEIVCDSSTYPESSHNYSNNMSKTWEFNCHGANKLTLKFSSLTATENKYDYIYIYDYKGNQIGKYSGSELSSAELELEGDSFKIKLTSDSSNVKYGFKFDSITATKLNNVILSEKEIPAAYDHDWSDRNGVCGNGCGTECSHPSYTQAVCDICGGDCETLGHIFNPEIGGCSVCGHKCETMGHIFNSADSGCLVCAITGGICGENLEWILNADGELEITGTGDMTDWVSYSSVPWYKHRTSIKSVTIPDNVTSIGDYAFYGCSGITNILIPRSIISIGSNAFYNCSGLSVTYYPGTMTEWQSITIGSNNNYLTKYVVYEYGTENANYGSGTINSTITWTLYENGNLVIEGSGAIPNYSESSVPWYSVREKIRNIYIPAGITNIGASVFNGCTNIESFSVDENNYYFSTDENGVLFNYDKSKLIKYPAKSEYTEYTIPDSVGTIRIKAFEQAKNLTSVTMNTGITVIGESAFKGCSNIFQASYYGTKDEWNSINVGSYNECITDNLIYECGSENPYYDGGICGNNLEWALYSNGSLIISGTGSMNDYYTSTPAPWSNYRSKITSIKLSYGVTDIGNSAFAFCTNAESIEIPSSVTSIGQLAFAECDKIKEVTIPNRVKTVGSDAFRACDSLESVVFPNSVTSIGDSAFYMCTSLKNVTLPKNITLIDDYMFYKCSSLENVVISSNVSRIGTYAFYKSGIKTIILPDSVTSIDDYAFYGCSSLQELSYPVTAIIYNSSNVFGYCTNITKTTLTKGTTGIMRDFGDSTSSSSSYLYYKYTPWYISGCSEIVIGDGVKNISFGAFFDCSGLREVTLPASIENMSSRVFYHCFNINNLYFKGSIAQWCEITVEDLNPIIYAKDFYIDGELVEGDIVIPDGVTSIGFEAFADCDNITSVTIPDSVTSIGENAFGDCNGLISVKIGEGVSNIPQYAFAECTNLTTLIIGNNVTNIGDGAFADCENLKELTIPVTAKIYNSEDTFYGCTNLQKVTFTKGTTGVMQNYGTSTSETASTTYYGYTPWYLSNCGEIVIEEGVKSIGSYAFYGLNRIETLIVPDSITSIGNCAFYNCNGITELTMPISAKIYNGNTFYGCYNIEKTIFTKGSGSMPDYGTSKSTTTSTTYYGYTPWYISGCPEIVLPRGIATIGLYAFYNCTNISTVKFEGTSDEFFEIVIKSYNDPLINAIISFNAYSTKWICGDAVEKKILRVGDKIVPPDMECAEGYAIADWTPEIPDTMPAEDLTFTAILKPKPYNVEWIFDDAVTEETIEYGQTISKPANPEKAGYTFVGWTPEIPETMPASDMSFTAVFKANSYNAVFNANGGAWSDGETTKTVATDFDSEIIAPEAPEKQGYIFSGWSPKVGTMDDVNGKAFNAVWIASTDTRYTVETYTMNTEGEYVKTVQNYTGETDSTANAEYTVAKGFTLNEEKSVLSGVISADNSLVLKVYFDRNKYTFTSVVDGTATETEYLYGSIIAEPAAQVKTGYTFAGWDKLIPNTMPAEDFTVTARFTANSYNAVFNAKGGKWSGGATTKTVATDFGSNIVAPANPTRQGYDFAGWDNEIGIMDDVNGKTFSAKWTARNDTKYTIEIYTMDAYGKYTSSKETKKGTTDTEATVTANAQTGFTVNSTKSNLSGNIAGDGSLVLRIYYDRNKYKFITNIDGNTTSKDYYYDAPVTMPANPDKPGYKFIGWDKTIPSKMPANDVTVTAVFKQILLKMSIRNPSTTTIKYGDKIILHADMNEALPNGWTIKWTADNGNFSYNVSSDGTTCTISPNKSGDTTFTATVYDENGNEISKDTQTMKSKAGFFDKIIAFFKKIFGATKTIPQIYKGIF